MDTGMKLILLFSPWLSSSILSVLEQNTYLLLFIRISNHYILLFGYSIQRWNTDWMNYYIHTHIWLFVQLWLNELLSTIFFFEITDFYGIYRSTTWPLSKRWKLIRVGKVATANSSHRQWLWCSCLFYFFFLRAFDPEWCKLATLTFNVF